MINEYIMTGAELVDAGWTRRELPGFIGAAGPLWTKKLNGQWVYGLLPDQSHLNPAGWVHGGALLTLADHAMSAVAWETSNRLPCVTLDISAQFITAVRTDQFVSAQASVIRSSSKLVFMACELSIGEDVALRAHAILKVLNKPSG